MTPDDVIAKLVDTVADLKRRINAINRIEQLGINFVVAGRQGGSSTGWALAGTSDYSLTQHVKFYIGCVDVVINIGSTNGNTTVTLPTAYATSSFLSCATIRGTGALNVWINTQEIATNQFRIHCTLTAAAGATTTIHCHWWTWGPP